MKNDQHLHEFLRAYSVYVRNDVETDIKMLDTTWIEQLRAKSLTRDRVRVFNATFKNISAISWRSALLVEEIGST